MRLFTSCRINAGLFDVLVGDDGRIASIDPAPSTHRDDDGIPLEDCSRFHVSPGFIDVQFNGAFGVDFSDGNLTTTALAKVLQQLPVFGVTSACITLISSNESTYRQAARVVEELAAADTSSESSPSCRIIGLHLEGPFLSPDKKGAHAKHHLCSPPADYASLLKFYGVDPSTQAASGTVRIVTLAPELPGAREAISALCSSGIVVAIGHSTTDYAGASDAVTAGATLVTHMFNAMNPFSHREPGIPGLLGTARNSVSPQTPSLHTATTVADGAAASGTRAAANAFPVFGDRTAPPLAPTNRAFYSLIADGVHLHPSALALAYRAHPQGAICVTDAMLALGLPPGSYHYGDLPVTVFPGSRCATDGSGGFYLGPHAVVSGTQTLAGAIVPLDECVRNLRAYVGCSLDEAIDTATSHPARLLGIEGKVGRLVRGAWADILLLDPQSGAVCATFIGGRRWRGPAARGGSTASVSP